jgi:hypothetical protein
VHNDEDPPTFTLERSTARVCGDRCAPRRMEGAFVDSPACSTLCGAIIEFLFELANGCFPAVSARRLPIVAVPLVNLSLGMRRVSWRA